VQYAAAASIFNVNRWTNRDLLLVAPLAKKYYVYRPADLSDNIATSIVVPAHIAAAAQIDQSYLLDGAIVDPVQYMVLRGHPSLLPHKRYRDRSIRFRRATRVPSALRQRNVRHL